MRLSEKPGFLKLNSKGSVMVYLLALVIFIAALAFSFAGTAKLYIDDMQSMKRFRGRAFSLNQIQKMLSTTKSLSESARFLPQNNALQVCLEGGANGTCTENCCEGNIEQGFSFKDPLDTAPQIEMKRTLSAPPGSPVYYKADGGVCLSAQQGSLSGCAYGLTSTFIAQCPGGTASCDHAEHLQIKVQMKPLGSFSQIKEKEFVSYYFPKVNYQPVVPVIGDQTLTVSVPVSIPMTGDPGHPSEVQNFKFEQCVSSNAAIVKVQCLAFAGGVGQIVLEPLAVGTTTITLQINDGGLTNFLSKASIFNVVVSP